MSATTAEPPAQAGDVERTAAPGGVDPRGLRFAAAVTSLVLAAAIVTVTAAPLIATILTAASAIVFALGSFLGVRYSPYGRLFARFIRPRLGAPAELEDPRPPRFAQTVGLVFSLIALAGLAWSSAPVTFIALGFALVAALLNAAVGLCLGCELYLLVRRTTHRRA